MLVTDFIIIPETLVKKITKLFLSSNALLIALFFCAGCATIEDKVYLQKAEVSGPVYQPPIIITGKKPDSTITLSARFYSNTTDRIHAQITNSLDIPPSEFSQEGRLPFDDWSWTGSDNSKGARNFRWNMPDLYAGVDADFPVSRSISLLLGFTYSSAGNTNLYGGSLGLSTFSMHKGVGVRFDFGTSLQQYNYDVYSLLLRRTTYWNSEEKQTMYLLHDVDKNTSLNFYLNLTLNFEYDKSPADFFFSLAYFNQQFLDFEPSTPYMHYTQPGNTLSEDHIYTDAHGEVANSYISFTPGLYFNISGFQRLVLGAGILHSVSRLPGTTSSWFVTPMIKMDFLL